jgi:hypothetical protein
VAEGRNTKEKRSVGPPANVNNRGGIAHAFATASVPAAIEMIINNQIALPVYRKYGTRDCQALNMKA